MERLCERKADLWLATYPCKYVNVDDDDKALQQTPLLPSIVYIRINLFKVQTRYQKWHATKCGAGQICRADLNGDNLRIYRAYLRISDCCRVTVRVRVMVRVRVRVRNMVSVRVSIGLALGLGLLIVVYKLLEKVTKCGSITWSKLTNGDPPADPPRSTFCRVPSYVTHNATVISTRGKYLAVQSRLCTTSTDMVISVQQRNDVCQKCVHILLTSYLKNFVESSKFISSFFMGWSMVASARQRSVSRPTSTRQQQ